MAIVRWEPFRDLVSAAGPHEPHLRRRVPRAPAARRDEEDWALGGSWAPAVDIFEKDGNIVLKAELPGVDPKDVDIRVENNMLTLRGERKFENEVKREHYHRVERAYGDVQPLVHAADRRRHREDQGRVQGRRAARDPAEARGGQAEADLDRGHQVTPRAKKAKLARSARPAWTPGSRQAGLPARPRVAPSPLRVRDRRVREACTTPSPRYRSEADQGRGGTIPDTADKLLTVLALRILTVAEIGLLAVRAPASTERPADRGQL